MARAVRASSCAASRSTSAAVALAWSSSTVSAPTMAEATAGRDSSQASETWYGASPQARLSRSTSRAMPISASENPAAAEALVAGDLTVEDTQVGEQAAVQRRVGDDRQPEPLAGGAEFSFGGPVDEVVLHLGGDRCLQAPVVGDPQGLGDLPGGMVGQADVADLALPDQVVVDREGLLQRRVRVGVVGVVEVDVVGLQAAQAGLDLTDDVAA